MTSEQPEAYGVIQLTGELQATSMTLRDWFAGQALTGLLAGRECLTKDDAVLFAWNIANAMMEERPKS